MAATIGAKAMWEISLIVISRLSDTASLAPNRRAAGERSDSRPVRECGRRRRLSPRCHLRFHPAGQFEEKPLLLEEGDFQVREVFPFEDEDVDIRW